MFSLLLAIIYIAFISLGLPDSLLGAGWPVMHLQLDAPLSAAGLITMIVSAGTIASSLLSDRLTRRWGAGLVTAVSVGATAVALMGFSFSTALWMLCLWAIPYGLGAGAVDAALNNFVALHYSSRQMSWLHAFWGVGVSVSPYIMSTCLAHRLGWEMGYRSVSVIQLVLTALLVLSLPLWKKKKTPAGEEVVAASLTLRQSLGLRGVRYVLIAFCAYCAVEATAGLWASSYMVESRGVDPEIAARFAALFYLGETAGRFLTGFVADRWGDKKMIRIGALTMLGGILLILLPIRADAVALAGLVVLGFGAAPVYPCIIHSTPANFGKENSQSLVGLQMASAYTGMTLMPPIFGLIAQHCSIALYPVYLLVFTALLVVMTELLNKAVLPRYGIHK